MSCQMQLAVLTLILIHITDNMHNNKQIALLRIHYLFIYFFIFTRNKNNEQNKKEN